MVENRDVTARLGDAQPALHNLQEYVWACRQVGYSHPDLTLHAGQLRDWYDSEFGMDLAMLDRDGTAFHTAAAACQEALAVQHRQAGALLSAWVGPGAQACQDFLRRHDQISAAVASVVRTAADMLTDTADRLWRLVDAKADAVVEIEGRTAAERSDWLAAAATLSSGAGDRAAASELVDLAVKPFVHSAVGADWLSVMTDTLAGVSEAYRDAAAQVALESLPEFAVPAGLGPVHPGPAAAECADGCPPTSCAPTAVSAAPTAPSSWSAPAVPPAGMPAPATSPAAAEPSPTAPAPVAAPPAPAAALGPPGAFGSPADLGGAGPGGLGGFGGLGQQFSEMLRGLLGGGAAGFESPEIEPSAFDDSGLDDFDTDDEGDSPSEDEGDTDSEETDTEDGTGLGDEGESGEDAPVEADLPADDCPPPVEESTAAPVITPPPPPVEPLPAPPVEPLPAQESPCAIAVGEVPQVGESPDERGTAKEPGGG
ncbi:hypothetical protein [Mycobacterium sp. SMC-4]|uniref:hypothetical protein n=1 Tax=Mycobacterium sp. SMC-4 TaxID=2857059 RepID=UPI0021B2BB04|nr:hypothetical protein [Mycobacterium sp. SMC-4]UXA19039.1 hypothetical protein KXD98_05085 [Mycobacterium sp. SMC-4]